VSVCVCVICHSLIDFKKMGAENCIKDYNS